MSASLPHRAYEMVALDVRKPAEIARVSNDERLAIRHVYATPADVVEGCFDMVSTRLQHGRLGARHVKQL